MPGRTIWLLLALVGCTEPGAAAPARHGAHGVRVVSLHDVTTEIVVALGAADRLVGIAEPVDPAPEVRPAVAAVPVVAGGESVLAVRPDVVLGLGVVGEQDPALVDLLRRSGVEVFLADPATLDDVAGLVRAVAARVGAAAAGDVIAERFLVAAQRAGIPDGAAGVAGPPRTSATPGSPRTSATPGSPRTSTTSAPPRTSATPGSPRTSATPARSQPVRVFVYDCCDPPFTAGGRTVLTDLIARAGGRNVFADVDADWTHVSWEEAVARRPELVVIHAYRYEGQGDAAAKERALLAVPALAALPRAVVPLRLSLGGLGSVEAIERLRAALEAVP